MTNRLVQQTTDIKPTFMIDTYNNDDEQIPLVDVSNDVKKSKDVNNNILEQVDDGCRGGVQSEDSKNY